MPVYDCISDKEILSKLDIKKEMAANEESTKEEEAGLDEKTTKEEEEAGLQEEVATMDPYGELEEDDGGLYPMQGSTFKRL